MLLFRGRVFDLQVSARGLWELVCEFFAITNEHRDVH